MNKFGKGSIEDIILAIIKIGLTFLVGYLIVKAFQGG